MTSNGHERARPLRTGDPHELGDYRLIGRLGRGGMGTVYLAKDPTDRHVAVKLIHPDLSDDDDFRRRFAREVASARRVARFSTAGVLDARLDGDPLFIVSEYVPGPNLAEAIEDDGPMDGGTLEGLAMGVAAALTAIHGAGVIHRDLKPANVLLSSVGPKVIDFGIARAMDDASSVTRSSQLMGTPAYLAPELIIGQAITPASDIFSWGCLVAFAGTGTTPFDAPTVPAVLHQISSAPPNLEGLDPTLRELVLKALDKEPTNRPTAQQLLNRLVGQEDPSESVIDRTVVRSWTPPSTARPSSEDTAEGAAAVGAAGVAGAAAGAAAVGIGGTEPLAPDTEAEVGTDTDPGDRTTADLGRQPTTALPPEEPPSGPQFAPTRPYDPVQAPPPAGQSAFSHTPPSGPMHGFPPPGPPSGPQQGASGPQQGGPYGPGGGSPGGPPSGPNQGPYGGPPMGPGGYHSGPQPSGLGPPPNGPQQGPPPGGPYGPPSGPQHNPYLPQAGQHSPPFGQQGHAPESGAGGNGPGGYNGGDRGTGSTAGGGAGSGRGGKLKLYGAGAAALVLIAAAIYGGVTLFGDPSFEPGTEVYTEDFTSVTTGWYDEDAYDNEVFEDDSRSGHIDQGFSARASSGEPVTQVYGDVADELPAKSSIAADLTFKSGPSYATAGLVCLGYSEEVEYEQVYTQYEVLVRKDGNGALIRRADGAGGGGNELEKTDSVPGYEAKQENRFQITCEVDEKAKATTIRLWIDDEFVLEAVDTSSKRLKKGYAGMIVRRDVGGSGGDAIAHYDDFRIGDLTEDEDKSE